MALALFLGKMRMEISLTCEPLLPFPTKNFRKLALATAPMGPGSSAINQMSKKMCALRVPEGFRKIDSPWH
jgi:hypothetical protein